LDIGLAIGIGIHREDIRFGTKRVGMSHTYMLEREGSRIGNKAVSGQKRASVMEGSGTKTVFLVAGWVR
jgi:hypothetical protein